MPPVSSAGLRFLHFVLVLSIPFLILFLLKKQIHAQSQQYNNQKGLKKVKLTIKTSVRRQERLSGVFFDILYFFSSVSTADFEQVNIW